MKPSSTQLFTLAATLITHIYSQPTPSMPILYRPGSISNLGVNSLGNPFECYDPMYHSRRAEFGDCAKAIALLPNLDTHGDFGTDGDPNTNPYFLPRIEKYEDCEVSIGMVDMDAKDDSSWDTINIAAVEIIDACARGYGDGAKTGGETTAGTHGRIKVSVGYTDRI